MFGAGVGALRKKVAHYKKKVTHYKKLVPETRKLVPETRNKNQCYCRPLSEPDVEKHYADDVIL